MPKTSFILLPILAAFAILAACNSDSDTSSGDSGSTLKRCTDPRPEVCTLEYDPVCGVTRDGKTKTYATACNACSNQEVMGYYPKACK
ncbi:MAG: hypothetical protein U9Q71_02950 [Pseudomonadota bacterium]|nr:hypothetical protein [Pseudomonadota bacterium]